MCVRIELKYLAVFMIKKHVVCLLIGWFSLVELFSYADIIYLEREIVVGWVSVEDSDIVYLKNGRQIKGRIVERSPQQVKIEVNVLNDEIVDLSTYRADEVEKVVVRLSKKRLNRDSIGCVHIGCGLIVLFLLIFPVS